MNTATAMLRLLVGLALTGGSINALAGEVSVAVAANFAGPLAKIAEGFAAATGHQLRISVGSTGKTRASGGM